MSSAATCDRIRQQSPGIAQPARFNEAAPAPASSDEAAPAQALRAQLQTSRERTEETARTRAARQYESGASRLAGWARG